MGEEREPLEYLEVPIPQSVGRRLREVVAREMGLLPEQAAGDWFYTLVNPDAVGRVVTEALRQWFAGKVAGDVTKPLHCPFCMVPIAAEPDVRYSEYGDTDYFDCPACNRSFTVWDEEWQEWRSTGSSAPSSPAGS